MQNIRVKAVCLFRHQQRILLAEGYDPRKEEHYLIPIGGGVDFAEQAQSAAIREVQEEISAEAYDVTLLGVSENIFTYNGTPGHEIVFVYQGKLRDETLYQREIIDGIESNGDKLVVRWFDEAAVMQESTTLYPDGLKAMLKKSGV